MANGLYCKVGENAILGLLRVEMVRNMCCHNKYSLNDLLRDQYLPELFKFMAHSLQSDC